MTTQWLRSAAIVAALLAPLDGAHAAWNETVLRFFTRTNGAYPQGALVSDADGNLYGTTSGSLTWDVDRSYNFGLVFKLTPPAAGKIGWTETVIHVFTGADGAYPEAGLVFDAAGNLYGTTSLYGGDVGAWDHGYGTVFKLTPPAAGKNDWPETVVYRFTRSADGAFPKAGLVLDTVGNLYGTTTGGGLSGCVQLCGTVFKLAPPAAGKTGWTETVLHFFTGPNGADPTAGVIFDAAGNLYGTTFVGGGVPSCAPGGCGIVFKLTPAAGQTAWTETVLHFFTGPNGAGPGATLIFDAAGKNLYGTTAYGGTSKSYGTVFELTPP